MGDVGKWPGPRHAGSRWVIWAIGVMGLLVLGAALSWPYLCARAIETKLQAWVQASDPQGEWVWRKLTHQRGWLRSSGSVELLVRSRCSTQAALREGGVLVLRYELLHWPTLDAASSFSWQLRPADSAQGRLIRAQLGTQAPATGEGHIGWDRSMHSSFHLPPVHAQLAQFFWRSAGAQGQLSWTHSGLLASAQLGQLSAQRSGWSLNARGLALQVSWPPGPTGLGDVTLQARTVQAPDWALNNLSLASRTHEDSGRLSSSWRQRVAVAQWHDETFRDLSLELSLRDLDVASLTTLGGIFGQSCRLERLSLDDGRRWRQALRTLLNRGLSVAVTHLAARRTTGESEAELDGSWSLGLSPDGQADRVSLSEHLASEGVLTIRGVDLPATMRDSALGSGYFTSTADGLRGAYRYAQGRLTLGNQTEPITVTPVWLGWIDRGIAALLNPEAPSAAPEPTPGDVEPPSAWPDEPASAAAPAPSAPSAPSP